MIGDTLPTVATAVPIGIAFGVVLERTGLGDPRVIAGQFTGRDFTVVRVMFGAIVTAMLGVVWASAAGWIDRSTIAVPPTDIAAQIIGAVIFGGGFALAALCPGTACVAASSGRRDGIAAVAGMFAGTALTAVMWPALGAAAGVPREAAILPDDLGLPLWSVVLAVTVLSAIAAIVGRRFDPRGSVPAWRLTTGETVALVLAVAFLVVDGRAELGRVRLAEIAAEITSEADHVDALALAEWIRDGEPDLRVIDVREGLEDPSAYLIPGSRRVPLESLTTMPFAAGERVVLYSEGGAHAAQAWVLLRARGVTNPLVLKDGLAAWEDEVLAPARPSVPDDTAQARFRRARDLALWFGGMPRLVPLPDESRPVTGSRPRRRNTC